MKVRFAVLADYSNVTIDGKINIVGVFDFIHAPKFPATHSEMQLVMRFEADIAERKEQKDIQVRLINEQGNHILELNGRIVVPDTKPGDPLFHNQVLTFRNITFPTVGDYQFDIYVDGRLAYSVPLKAFQTPQGHKA